MEDRIKRDTRYQLLRQLADGRFHSGEALASGFGISRAAVWKHLQRLREQLGVEIHALPGKGYRLAQSIELLDQAHINAALPRETLARIQRLVLHDQVDSTNAWLMQQAAAGAASGTVCIAEQQTAGRGRRGRTWVSPFGNNIYLSLLWQYELPPVQLSGLSLMMGLAVLRTLHRLGVRQVGLKWPNDLLAGGRKLAGLLLEMAGETQGPSRVVVGVGINLWLPDRQGMGIDQPWTDLETLCGGQKPSRNRLVAALLESLIEGLMVFEERGLAPWIDEWNRFDLFLNRRVVVSEGQRRSAGIHRGIDAHGALLLETDGRLSACYGGEVSLRFDE